MSLPSSHIEGQQKAVSPLSRQGALGLSMETPGLVPLAEALPELEASRRPPEHHRDPGASNPARQGWGKGGQGVRGQQCPTRGLYTSADNQVGPRGPGGRDLPPGAESRPTAVLGSRGSSSQHTGVKASRGGHARRTCVLFDPGFSFHNNADPCWDSQPSHDGWPVSRMTGSVWAKRGP